MYKMQILSALRMIKHIPIIPYLCQSAVCNYSLLHLRWKNHGMTKMLKNRTMYEKWRHNQDDGETKLWKNKKNYVKLFVTKDFWPVQAVLTSAIPIDSKKSGNPAKVVAKNLSLLLTMASSSIGLMTVLMCQYVVTSRSLFSWTNIRDGDLRPWPSARVPSDSYHIDHDEQHDHHQDQYNLGIVISGLGPGHESQTTPRTSSLPRVASCRPWCHWLCKV